jgi:glucose/arabinose dehydrogenase
MSRTHRLAFLAAALAVAPLFAQAPPGDLPPPFATPSVTRQPKVVGWPDGKTPTAPAGFIVTLFAKDLNNPRWMYVLPNGDVLVAESKTPAKKDAKAEEKKEKDTKPVPAGSANRITLLRDADKDGTPEVREPFLTDLYHPLGMVLVKDTLYVANTDSVMAFPYKDGDTRITAKGRHIQALPALGYNNHWTRNVVANADGTKLYVTVGSGSNVGENGMLNELLRACILEMNPDGTGLRVFAGGLRNPVGMDWEPTTKALWTAVNERDHLGDELVPDYMTLVKDGAFYGWPFAYFGPNEDPRRKGERPDLVAKTVRPDVDLGAHTASLGLTFYRGTTFPEKYRGGAFVGQRGSWNRSKFAGYRVAFVPFKDGKPAGPPEDFLTGFIKEEPEVYGRPVGVCVAPDGALLVTDDVSNRVWRVAAGK